MGAIRRWLGTKVSSSGELGEASELGESPELGEDRAHAPYKFDHGHDHGRNRKGS
jgi:hypothetical protein